MAATFATRSQTRASQINLENKQKYTVEPQAKKTNRNARPSFFRALLQALSALSF